jgi:hypothetical protein
VHCADGDPRSAVGRVSRRELFAAGAAVGAAVAFREDAASASRRQAVTDFTRAGTGDGWPGWACVGVANLRRDGSAGLLEAGSDVFPNDPRPVAFMVDRRFRDGEVEATVSAAGAGAGVVIRRVAHRRYYAAIYDAERGRLTIVRRLASVAEEVAAVDVGAVDGSFRLALSAHGARPTRLVATIEPVNGPGHSVTGRDSTARLQRAGDPGVLATARTLFPSDGSVVPALGNVHLLPYGVQEGEVVIESPVGEELLATIRERSTAAFALIRAHSKRPLGVTPASVVAATTGAPIARGAKLRATLDLPGKVEFLVSGDRHFRSSEVVARKRTGNFAAAIAGVAHAKAGRRVYWRARARRRGRTALGPVRSFRVLPAAGSGDRAKVAIGACASQFTPIFDVLGERDPDVFVWQGDLNYPDTVGPLAQTTACYAGIWRDFLSNPRTAGLLSRSAFAVQRDDHDYGVQDANSTNLVPWGLAPWEALMERRTYYRFAAGLAEFWVLDQRQFKSDPNLPDTTDKTLLGGKQRAWLLRTLSSSRATFKVICSPCTLAPLPANARDGSWAAGFTAERDLILDHVDKRVRGRTLFVTGDTHWTMAYDTPELYEARPCPLGIPTPNDITISDPFAAQKARGTPGVAYADDQNGHFALVEVSGADGGPRLDLTLVRADGQEPYRRSFAS